MLATEFLPSKFPRGSLTVTAEDFASVWYAKQGIFTNVVEMRLIERLRWEHTIE
ncbi:hypothetical protein Pmar_PMAR012641 [Perkinsus marinus ATCC 50983]|uniref:Uncharacterized protein n=1 Tax=Perkinsus marinus (strain ATCC 50983 / TXsc) TaxID=423536 RepID=C5K7X3_PERM5|nr:hypothetical protein Pmar_PMAR012641 [Perkinsus marinus ATCC 50983]EER19658.1 hypothetical protein Pmar_PMAR012641 [Perkinsus marinus ATCC 50983]|eukprot:XP_002787862.1 hypothetical protein Pmar_PMAR012641 [Perkinsus marinus ATCC 50983]